MRGLYAIFMALAVVCSTAQAAEGDRLEALTPGSGQSASDKLADGKDCAFCPEMVVVPAGSFMMGSPADEPEREPFAEGAESQVRVSIARTFAVGKFAVTFAEWDACAADGGCLLYKPSDEGWGRGKHPVINVNWHFAKLYATWLSRKTGKTYRLLSEAEHEYVTRAGSKSPFWWGSAITPAQANYDGSTKPYEGGGAKGEYRRRTAPVDSFTPNPWGLYQVHGNVLEWTEDCSIVSNVGNPGNGSARMTGGTMIAGECQARVIRGGAWSSEPKWLRAGFRAGSKSDTIANLLGFRLARDLAP